MIIPSLCFASASRDFDGSNDKINCGAGASLDITSDITLCQWIQFDTFSATAYNMASKDKDTGGRAFTMDWNTVVLFVSAQYRFYINGGAGADIILSSTYTTHAGIWRYVCGTWLDSTDKINLYVNGVSDATEGTTTTSTIPTATANFTIAAREYADFNDFGDGKYSFTHLFARVLSVPEINNLMWLPDSVSGSMRGYWAILGDSTEKDLSGNGNDGTITESTLSTTGPTVGFGMFLPL